MDNNQILYIIGSVLVLGVAPIGTLIICLILNNKMKKQPSQSTEETLKSWMEKYVVLSDYVYDEKFTVKVNKEMLIDLIETVKKSKNDKNLG